MTIADVHEGHFVSHRARSRGSIETNVVSHRNVRKNPKTRADGKKGEANEEKESQEEILEEQGPAGQRCVLMALKRYEKA